MARGWSQPCQFHRHALQNPFKHGQVLVEQSIENSARIGPKLNSVVPRINVVQLFDGTLKTPPLCGSREGKSL